MVVCFCIDDWRYFSRMSNVTGYGVKAFVARSFGNFS